MRNAGQKRHILCSSNIRMHVASVLRRERDGCMFHTMIIRQENGRHARLTKREPDRERQSRAHKIISERVVMPLARMSHGVRRIFYGARFTHGFIISSPNDDEKEQIHRFLPRARCIAR